MSRTKEEFLLSVKNNRLKEFHVRNCSFCGYHLKYVFKDSGVFYDKGCDCTNQSNNLEPRTYQDIADFYNMQTNPDYIEQLDIFFDFKSNPDNNVKAELDVVNNSTKKIFSIEEMVSFGEFMRDNYYVAGLPKMVSYYPDKYPNGKVSDIFFIWAKENNKF